MNLIKKAITLSLAAAMAVSLSACGGTQASKQVVFYTNADDEAVAAMQDALDNNGFSGQYLLQSFGTSELGGKLMAEGGKLEADLLTMSSYYVESAQKQNKMFLPLTFERQPLSAFPDYAAPITSQEGAIIINTEALAQNNLERPASFKDLAKPEYANQISVPDITGSSTAWLMVQGILNAYGETHGKEVMRAILKNAGPHVESSGSAPLKKVRAGEVAIAFGLRHQAVADKKEGLPVDYIDPIEGNFSLTESIAVVDKGDKTNPLAMEMAACIIQKGREALQKTYPNPIYKGESTDKSAASQYPKTFPEALTVELLKKHQEFSESCK